MALSKVLLERATRRLSKFGTQAFMVLYDPDWEDGFGLPMIETINTALSNTWETAEVSSWILVETSTWTIE